MHRRPPTSPLFPHTTLFRSPTEARMFANLATALWFVGKNDQALVAQQQAIALSPDDWTLYNNLGEILKKLGRSEEHTSELQSHVNLVCRLLLEKKKKKKKIS